MVSQVAELHCSDGMLPTEQLSYLLRRDDTAKHLSLLLQTADFLLVHEDCTRGWTD